MYFRFTLFNSITLLIMALTVFMIYARFRFRLENTWLLLFYAAIIGYWKGFAGSLNTYWVLAGLGSGLLLRFEFLGGSPLMAVRVVELGFLGYVLWRCAGLLLLWPW